jgi:hypothetical protein
MENVPQPIPWTYLKMVAFRLLATYILIYVGASGWELTGLPNPLESLIKWVGRTLLHINTRMDTRDTGSGDTSYMYVLTFVQIVLALIASIIWTVADNKRNNYNKLLYWVTAIVRYYLAFFLLVYGYSKFNHGQFPAPDLDRLLETYGESSPMGLAWSFLGFSSAYGIFMGFFESLGGALMLFRRTTVFGACIATTVTANVVAINFCYDVPVKLFSSHLLLLCLFILLTEGKRLLDFFLFNKPIKPADLTPIFTSKKWLRARIVLKSVFIPLITLAPLALIIYEQAEYGDEPKSALYGIYYVQDFVRNNDTLPAVATDSSRWDKLVMEYEGSATVFNMARQKKYANLKIDTAQKTITIYTYKDSAKKNYTLSYTKTGGFLTLQGVYKGDSLYVSMQRLDDKKILLTHRGFHWINEYPFNR